jgi:hypothetical protein
MKNPFPRTVLLLFALALSATAGDGPASPQLSGTQDTALAVEHLLEQPLRDTIRDQLHAMHSAKLDTAPIASFPVDASSSAWQNSGILVRSGQQVSIEASGTDSWTLAGAGNCNAGGFNSVPGRGGTPAFHTGTEGDDWHWGALVCAIASGLHELPDSNRQVEIGRGRQFIARQTGYIYLICNDTSDGDTGFSKNSGLVHVSIKVRDVAGAETGITQSAPSQPASSPALTPITDAQAPSAIAQRILGPLREMIKETFAAAAPASATSRQGVPFPVDASSPDWQNSGVLIKAGDHVTVEAEDDEKWNIGWDLVNAAGHPSPRNSVSGDPVFHAGTPNDDWHWGAMICAIGKDRSQLDDPEHEVEVGLKRGFKVDDGGYLYFLANDNRQLPDGRNGYADNSGIIHVFVTVDKTATASPTPAPKPALINPGTVPATTGS